MADNVYAEVALRRPVDVAVNSRKVVVFFFVRPLFWGRLDIIENNSTWLLKIAAIKAGLFFMQ